MLTNLFLSEATITKRFPDLSSRSLSSRAIGGVSVIKNDPVKTLSLSSTTSTFNPFCPGCSLIVVESAKDEENVTGYH